jgi:hypothetical protein
MDGESLFEWGPTYAGAVALRILARLVYWLVVLAVSVVLLVLLVSFFESRDDSQLDAGFGLAPLLRSSAGSLST